MAVDHTLVQCPACQGEKGGHGFATRRDRCGVEWIPCTICRGNGEVTVSRKQVYERGRALWERRTALDLSLRDAARRWGMSVVELSDAEHGRALLETIEKVERALTAMEQSHVE